MENKNLRRIPIRDIPNTYCKRALAAAVIIGLIAITFGFNGIGKGLILGTLFSVANFIALALMLSQNTYQRRGKSSLFSFFSLSGRYLLMAVPILLALKLKTFDLPATVAGLFMVQIIILCEQAGHLIKQARKISV
ncbi:MAG: ATP synthase subunit I [Thermodesulfobacteriota bacterium]